MLLSAIHRMSHQCTFQHLIRTGIDCTVVEFVHKICKINYENGIILSSLMELKLAIHISYEFQNRWHFKRMKLKLLSQTSEIILREMSNAIYIPSFDDNADGLSLILNSLLSLHHFSFKIYFTMLIKSLQWKVQSSKSSVFLHMKQKQHTILMWLSCQWSFLIF